MRVKKWVRNQQRQINSTVYIDGAFEHHRQINGQATIENNTLHVMDNQNRIALVRVGAPLDHRDASPLVPYHLGDHLGSSAVVVGGDNSQANAFINREEYFPYGETSFGSFAKKRYRYSGKERDEESGLYYYGARYLAPWLLRWVSCDPLDRWTISISSAHFRATLSDFQTATVFKRRKQEETQLQERLLLRIMLLLHLTTRLSTQRIRSLPAILFTGNLLTTYGSAKELASAS